MENSFILAINPGSTSTKFAVFEGKNHLMKETIRHKDEDLIKFPKIADQLDYRYNLLIDYLQKNEFDITKLNAIVGRGGFLKPLPSGTYLVDEDMINDLESAKYGEHASNLGALISYKLAKQLNIPAYIVDPVVVDEFEDVSRISGIVEIERRSNVHALNIKAVSRKIAEQFEKPYEKLNFVVAHLGGGISVVAHKQGKIVDVNNANNEGPFSPERSGGLPTYQLAELCYSGKFTKEEMLEKIAKKGGLYSYLGTKDEMEVEERIAHGDEKAKKILDAMIHQIAKEIGAMSTVLSGNVDGIILTGGLSYSDYIVSKVSSKTKFIAPIYVTPGEEELEALSLGALRVINNNETAKIYKDSVLI